MNTTITKLIGIATCFALVSCATESTSTTRSSSYSDPYPTGIPIPKKKGFVLSPYNQKVIDVRDIPAGTLVQDPTYASSERKYFRIPGGATQSIANGSSRLAALEAATNVGGDDIAPSAAGRTALAESQASSVPKEKSGFAKFLGGALEGAVMLAGGVAEVAVQNPQLLAGNSSGSSYNANAAAMQQIAAASTQSSSSFNSGYNSGASSQPSNSYDPNEGRKMSGVTQLGAAWMGVVNVVCHVKGENPGRNETTTQVSAAPSFVKKRNLSISIYYTVSGYDRDGKLSTKQFRDDVLVSGPYQHYAAISHGFQGGLRTVQITHVHCGGKALSAP